MGSFSPKGGDSSDRIKDGFHRYNFQQELRVPPSLLHRRQLTRYLTAGNRKINWNFLYFDIIVLSYLSFPRRRESLLQQVHI